MRVTNELLYNFTHHNCFVDSTNIQIGFEIDTLLKYKLKRSLNFNSNVIPH